jgi:hypothetical protein
LKEQCLDWRFDGFIAHEIRASFTPLLGSFFKIGDINPAFKNLKMAVVYKMLNSKNKFITFFISIA